MEIVEGGQKEIKQMTPIQQRLTERYKGYKQKDLYEQKKDILKEIKNNSDDYLLQEYKADIQELKRYYPDLR